MRVTLYMLRDRTDLSPDVLRDGSTFENVPLTPVKDVAWSLFIRAGQSKPASWVDAVRPVVVDDNALGRLRTQSSAGVLLVQTSQRLFAVTFGQGYHTLDPKYIEPGFGLRVTANVVAADQVTSADTKGFHQSARSQKTILPAASELYALGIEPSEEWVRQLGGRVSATSFATTAAGADSLRLSIKDFALRQLPEKLAQIWERYQSDDYKRDFGFLDNFIRLDSQDPMVKELDAEVEGMLLSQSPDLGFAAPDPFEQLGVDHYVIQYRKKLRCEELTRDEVYAALGDLRLPPDPLRKVSVLAQDVDGNPVDKRFDLYDYVQAEIARPDARYVLTAGAWFRVARTYLDEVNQYVASIEDLTEHFNLPAWDKKHLDDSEADTTAEGAYNAELAEDRSYALLDKRLLDFGRNQKFEICDLLTAGKELLCVKRESRSSTLSHLFAQGSVSASLMNEPAYQERLMRHLREVGQPEDIGSPSDWTFVYAIATDKPGKLADSLFFSKVNLVTHARDIRSRAFRVAVAKITVA